jgi:hypothetical protein
MERADSMMEAEKRKTAAGEKGERNESGILRRGKVPLKISAVGPGDGAASFGHRDADSSVVHTGCSLHGRPFITQHGPVPILAALRLGHGGRKSCNV